MTFLLELWDVDYIEKVFLLYFFLDICDFNGLWEGAIGKIQSLGSLLIALHSEL